MSRIFFILPLALLVLGVTSSQVLAQSNVREFISSYSADIQVNTDNSIDVVETIVYNSGGQEKHGIFRDIRTISSSGMKMPIEDILVQDELGKAYKFVVTETSDNLQIKIGDANVTFKGEKVYVIKYKADKAVSQFEEFDEIYWNVTGNKWPMPISSVLANVTFPKTASTTQAHCYSGAEGSTRTCQYSVEVGNTYTYKAPAGLLSYEGMTVALGFEKGTFEPYTLSDNLLQYISWMFLPLLTLLFSVLHWRRHGRDPKGTGVIIPQYDVPEDLTPMEVGAIVYEEVTAAQISSEIIYLATKGYIKINQLEDTILGFIKTKDYELVRLNSFSNLPNEFDRIILDGLFGQGQSEGEYLPSVRLSSLKDTFYKTVSKVNASVLDSLKSKGYYTNLGRMKGGPEAGRVALIIFMALWSSVMFGVLIGSFLIQDNPYPVIIGIFVSVVIYGVVSHFSPAKSERGVELKEYLLGLKNYLQIAEKDRLQFHNAPDKKPEVFEKLLPFAMVLDVSEIWAKEFEDIYSTPPDWYSAPAGTSFSAASFNSDLTSFGYVASSTLSSSPGSSSGSGGGGSSGGGGGGGGGGSW